ncbi:hypothetical protein N8772_03285 [Rickettsiales bacterium]|nr:hypothetical protein [Rickettsiales bacterium]
MLLTKKDRSFILLIISFIFLVYSIFSILPHVKSPFSSKNYKILLKEKSWLNVNERPKNDDLESRLILLSFLDEDRIKHREEEILLDSKNLKKKFGFDLTLITIYQGEENKEKIEKKINQFDLDFPVILDKYSNIFKYFQSDKYQFILLKPDGEIYKKYQLTDFNQLNKDISNLISNLEEIKEESFKIPYQQITASYILSSPTFIDYNTKNNNSSIYISNSGHNNIIISSLDGRIIKKIGSKDSGFNNGNIDEVKFNHPQNFTIDGDIIYLADSGNHAIRKIDLKSNKVTTLIGSGTKKGSYLKGTINTKRANLWFPTDVILSHDKKELIIANYGARQILSYNFKEKTLSSLTDPKIDIKPKKIHQYKKNIYFIDQNIIKFLNKKGEIKELKINNQIITSDSFHVTKNILINSNSKENKIEKINLDSKIINQIDVKHNESSDIININNNIYLVEPKNDRITQINVSNLKSKILDILPKLEVTEDKVIRYLPNFNFTDEIFVKSDSNINVTMNLKKGWKLNNQAPSFINLVEINSDKKAKLIKIFNWQDIKNNKIHLPKLKKDFIYYIKAIIYYRKDQENSICMVNEYHKKINVSHNISNKQINIDFIYQ